MEERAFEAAAGRYGLTDMVAAISMDRAELVVGFVPWEEDATGWARSVSRVRTTIEGEPRLSRTVWDDPARPGTRVAIDVYECDSAHQAVHALVEVLAGNHLASVPRGPEGVGLFSFAQPENLPPAVMMVRANLCLVVSSFGTDHVEIVPWAQRLDSRIVERPQAVEEVDLFTKQSRGDGMTLSYHTPWRVGEEGYVKIFSEGGGIEIRDGDLLVGGDEVVVEAYVVEPGRPTYRGRLDVSRP
jgi:hypothetical protein